MDRNLNISAGAGQPRVSYGHTGRLALPFWERLGNLEALAVECRRRPTFQIDVHYLEFVARAGVILGDDDIASAAFAAGRRVRPKGAWEQVVHDRVRRLDVAWSTDRSAALALLRDYRERTASAIGLLPQGFW